jgi:DNA-binding beta-propeller fold protein YncE
MNNIIVILGILLVSLGACKKDEPEIEELPQSSTIYYISNEGAYGFENASLSAYYPLENKVVNNAFEKVNNRGLGDVLQSTYHYKNKLFMMVNASSKIEIAETPSLKEIGVIPNVSMPRYMVGDDKTGFVSSWGNGGEVIVLNLETNKKIKSISVGSGPEHLMLTNQYIIVCNSGGFDVDSTISIIDKSLNIIVKTLKVGDIPMDLVLARDNKIWVLCKGQIIYNALWQVIGHTPSKLVKLSNSNLSIEKEIKLFDDQHPSQLAINSEDDILYIGGGFGFNGIYQFDLAAEKLDTNAISNKSFYGISYEEKSNLYGFESPDFTSSGKMYIMDDSAKVEKTFTVGIGPNGMTW